MIISSPTIKTNSRRFLIGNFVIMSRTENRTRELWSAFMPNRYRIENTISNDVFAVHEYPAHYFTNFDPSVKFTTWACREVDNHGAIPENMHPMTIPEGIYAVFKYTGTASEAPLAFRHIFGKWIPESSWKLDETRPHFEILGEDYNPLDPNAEEEIWIPVFE